ncbi:GH3 auxin-responsive promoter family protein [Akkermansiaceae bacterium]|nr:GH3 auxin-responsive promoter family protein [Akkermansiaceae bacterium]
MFGKAHGFGEIRTEADFRERVPERNYEDYGNWIARVANGEKGVLPCGEVIAFECTSGTSSGAKLIPVTEGLREDFAYGMAAWLGGWHESYPEVFGGRAYWAISPPGIARGRTAGGLPVGLDGDGAYFPDAIGARLSDWLVVPRLSGGASEVFAETAEELLRTPDLSLVSVWSPTFLLCIDAEVALRRPGKTWREIWPQLALVSCWADASSARWIPRLRDRLGGVPIEPKGLLATEGVTSIPVGSARLAHECHYHEFLDEDGNHLACEKLRIGMVCEVLISTSGGLMRYRSGDLVRITGFTEGGVPEMRFLGRKGIVSDLVGEKLAEEAVAAAFSEAGVCGFLAADPDVPGYEVWMEDTRKSARVISKLLENPYFKQALALGQLAPCKPMALKEGWVQDLSAALALKRGCRIGDVKLPVLYQQQSSGEVAEWMG